METLDEIWEGDLFGRRKEADNLIGYLESVARRPKVREDGHAHVLAVDASYGQGKTYFLRRFDRHLKSTDHVSAYVDTWVDDLEDQPIVALAATLEHALDPWLPKTPGLEGALETFKSKAGNVAKIIAIGAAKRAASFLITQGAMTALDAELAKSSSVSADMQKDALEGASAGLIADASAALDAAQPDMTARIMRFRQGQAAITEMKNSLTAVVDALAEAGMSLPITIIIDELDRCRPTYAIKTLEEIKHLFDVSGVAFVLGLHGQQLSHSVNAAYGQSFDGNGYLRRFFNRRYTLQPAKLERLVQHLLKLFNINEGLLNHPIMAIPGQRVLKLSNSEIIAVYLRLYGLTARDTFSVMESLQTATALVSGKPVQLSYLLPLLIGRHIGVDGVPTPVQDANCVIVIPKDHFGHDYTEFQVGNFANALSRAAAYDDQELSQSLNNSDVFARIVSDYGFKNQSDSLHLLQNYGELARVVERFD